MPRTHCSRREMIAGTMAAAGMATLPKAAMAAGSASPQCSVAASPTSAPAFSATPLGTIAAGKNIGLGIQLDVPSSQAYGAEVYDKVYQQVVLQEKPYFVAYGSAFKFGNVCPDPPQNGQLVFTYKAGGVTDTWSLAENLSSGLQSNNVHARADALIWNETAVSPSWLQTLPANATQSSSQYVYNLSWVAKYMSAAVKEMTQLQNGQPGFFFAAGLVNEPIVPNFNTPSNPSPATYRDGPWLPPGYQVASFNGVPDYIHDAFYYAEYYRTYWAKQLGVAATTAQWYINETLCDTDQFGPTVRPALLTLLKAMIAAKLNITAVGLECHLQPQMMNNVYQPDWTAFGSFIQAIGNLGLDVYITELDVFDYAASCGGHAAAPGDSDYLIDIYYTSFLSKVLSYSNVKVVTLWDLSDRYTFYRYLDASTWAGYNTIPRPKPAGTTWPNCPTLPANAAAVACPRPNAYDDTLKPKAARQKIADALSAAPSR